MALQNFTYDPTTQEYAQPTAAATPQRRGLFSLFFPSTGQTGSSNPFHELISSLFSGFGHRKDPSSSGMQNYSYDPATQQYTLANPTAPSGPTGIMDLIKQRIAERNGFAEGGEISMNSYAQGGLAAAQHAQSQGRGEDTMLVHMTPKEVAGLQALAMSRGGSLTINPHTGLPEAGFLSSILPVVAGAALTAFTGIPAWQIALGVGGATALATGSLGKGLMAGLGAYGGGNIGAGLVGAESIGAGQAGVAASQAEAMQQAAQMQALADQGIPLGPQAWNMAAIEEAKQKAVEEFAKKSALDQLGASATQIGQQPIGQTFNALGGKNAALTLLPSVLSGLSASVPKTTMQTQKQYIRPQSLDIQNLSGDVTPYSIGDSSERRQLAYTYTPQPIYTAAEGGLAALQEGGRFDDSQAPDMEPGYADGGGVKKSKPTSLKGDPWYKFAQDRRDSSMEASIDQNFAGGGALPPRFLSGGGDGMSDSIHANIDGKQEARLADGEFVISADVVSGLGNGSSKAGAKKLYAMMDRVRKARTGREKQAPAINAAKYMPA